MYKIFVGNKPIILTTKVETETNFKNFLIDSVDINKVLSKLKKDKYDAVHLIGSDKDELLKKFLSLLPNVIAAGGKVYNPNGDILFIFRNGKWDVMDKGTYVILKSRTGMSVEIYANKPTSEYAGQDAIKAHFASTGRWPDVVVHRGHSYFASAAIESLTPNAEIVFLGSCGGYNNIAQVLKYSPDAQIISSKQIGTMLVNDRLCLELNEVIRKGKDIVWDDLWDTLDKKFAAGSTADNRFQDYIPPHKNLGALLIKTYRRML